MGLEIFDLTGKVAMVTGSTRGLGEVRQWPCPRPGLMWRYAVGWRMI